MLIRPVYIVAGLLILAGTVAVFVLIWQKSGFLLYMSGFALATYAAGSGDGSDED